MVQEAPEADTALETAVKLFVTLYSCNKHANVNYYIILLYNPIAQQKQKQGQCPMYFSKCT